MEVLGDGEDAPEAGDPLTVLWRRRRAINESELAELRQGWPAPSGGRGTAMIELPQLPLDPGPALVEGLGDCLEAGGLRTAAPGVPTASGVAGVSGDAVPGGGGAGRWS